MCRSRFENGACEGWRVTPAIRAEKGWRGRRELAPRRSATRIRCMSVRSYRQRHVRDSPVRTTTTTTTSCLLLEVTLFSKGDQLLGR